MEGRLSKAASGRSEPEQPEGSPTAACPLLMCRCRHVPTHPPHRARRQRPGRGRGRLRDAFLERRWVKLGEGERGWGGLGLAAGWSESGAEARAAPLTPSRAMCSSKEEQRVNAITCEHPRELSLGLKGVLRHNPGEKPAWALC